MHDSEFNQANRILRGMLRKQKMDGLHTTKRKPVLTKKDLQQIMDYFAKDFDCNPVTLQQKVYFDLTFFMGRRGNEGNTALRKDSLEVNQAEDGRKILGDDIQ